MCLQKETARTVDMKVLLCETFVSSRRKALSVGVTVIESTHSDNEAKNPTPDLAIKRDSKSESGDSYSGDIGGSDE